MMKQKSILLLLLLSASFARAQELVAKRDMVTVEQEGFYELRLDSALLAFAGKSRNNLRVRHEDGHEIPYQYVQHGQAKQLRFSELSQIEIDYKRGHRTQVLLERERAGAWEDVYLRVTPAQVTKTGKISGSRDGENWFVVREAFLLRPTGSENGIHESRPVMCKGLDYPFLKIELADSLSAPLEILGVGSYYNEVTRTGKRTKLPPPKIERMPSDMESVFRLTWNRAYPLDQLELHFEGPTFYDRTAHIYTLAKRKEYRGRRKRLKKRKRRFQWVEDKRTLKTFAISSNQPKIQLSEYMKVDTLYLSIEKGQQAPVKLQSAKPSIVAEGLYLWLEKGDHEIELWEEFISAQFYVMNSFNAAMPTERQKDLIPLIKTAGDLYVAQVPRVAADMEKRGYWIYIALASVVLLVFVLVRVLLKRLPQTVPE